MSKTDLDRIFTYHAPFSDQAGRYVILRNAAKAFAEAVEAHCPPSRERSLAITRIQEACQMANASIAVNEVAPAAEEVPE